MYALNKVIICNMYTFLDDDDIKKSFLIIFFSKKMFEYTPGYILYKGFDFNFDEIDCLINKIIHGKQENFRISNEDIFRNEDDSIKQIQHLEIIDEIRSIGILLKNYFKINGYIINMQLFIKHPNIKITKPHQDGAYFGGDNYVTFWIPLEDVNELNSCLRYLEYSHKNLLNHKQSGNVFRIRSGVPGYSLEYLKEPLEKYKPVIMQKGDILIHHPYVLHYSDVNKTNSPRKAITCIFKLV